MSQAFIPMPELCCSQCGQPEAFAFDAPLCADCYHASGSCGAVREIENQEPLAEPNSRDDSTRANPDLP